MLDPHRLRVFRSVVASGSVQAAADNLGLTSSAVSQHLSALQRETGLTLFQRVGRGIAPTEAALVLDAQSDEVMSQWNRLDQVVADLRDGRSGRLSIGYFSSAGAAWMPSLVKRLTAEFPDLVLELVLNEVEQRVPRLDIDLVIDPPDGPLPSGYTRTELTEDQFVAIVPRGHPLADAGTIALTDLRGETWVSNDYPRAPRPPPRGRRVQRRRLPAEVQRAGPGPLHRDRLRRRGHRRLGAAGPRGAQPAGDGRAARPRGADAGAPPGGGGARPGRAEPAGRSGRWRCSRS